jgi:glycosyltransferase involved in cell wall biosynthesis
MQLTIYNPLATSESNGVFRGGGRIMQILHENLSNEATFVNSLKHIERTDTLLIPIWNPFEPPLIKKRIAQKQILIIFDVIPLKYPQHFPAGIKGNIHLWQNRQSFKHFDSFITISEHAKKDIIHYLDIPAEKISVVYPTYSQAFTKIYAQTNDKTPQNNAKDIVIYVGDINWNKNITTLAKAIKMAQLRGIFIGKAFKENHPDINHPWLHEFKQFQSELPGSHITFSGYVPDDELAKLYQNSLCNILISRDEGFGMSYLEAATQNCPSILSDIPVFHEIALSTARFVPADDPQEIAQALFELQNSPEICNKIAEEAFIRSKAFAPEAFKKRLLDVV